MKKSMGISGKHIELMALTSRLSNICDSLMGDIRSVIWKNRLYGFLAGFLVGMGVGWFL